MNNDLFCSNLVLLSQVIQVPQGRFKVLAPELTRAGPYPVALIPGQFQEYYKRYKPNCSPVRLNACTTYLYCQRVLV